MVQNLFKGKHSKTTQKKSLSIKSNFLDNFWFGKHFQEICFETNVKIRLML